MWAKSLLERYLEKIPEGKARDDFRALIKAVNWQGKAGFETGDENKIKELAARMGLAQTLHEMNKHTFELIGAGRKRTTTIPPQ